MSAQQARSTQQKAEPSFGPLLDLPANRPRAPETKSFAAGIPDDAERRRQLRLMCETVRRVVAELQGMTDDRKQERTDMRRAACHVRQIGMYVCHVSLQLSLTDIGFGFGRDRTTVAHACKMVEDRRDDTAYDEFVSLVERLVLCFFSPVQAAMPGGNHE